MGAIWGPRARLLETSGEEDMPTAGAGGEKKEAERNGLGLLQELQVTEARSVIGGDYLEPSEQKALNQAIAFGKPMARTHEAARGVGPTKQVEEAVAEVYTEGSLAKKGGTDPLATTPAARTALPQPHWACRSLTAVSEKLKAGELLE